MKWQTLFGEMRALLHKTDITSPGELVPGSVWRGQLAELFEQAHLEHPARWEDIHDYVRRHWVRDHDAHPLLCLESEREATRWRAIAPFASFFVIPHMLAHQVVGDLHVRATVSGVVSLDFFRHRWCERPGAGRTDLPGSVSREVVWPYRNLWLIRQGEEGAHRVLRQASGEQGFRLRDVMCLVPDVEIEARNLKADPNVGPSFFEGFSVGRDGVWTLQWNHKLTRF